MDKEEEFRLYEKYAEKRQKSLSDRLMNPHVLIVKTYHATEYYDALNINSFYNSVLFLLKSFHEDNLLVRDDNPPLPPSVAESVFEEMPDCNAKTAGLTDWERYKVEISRFEETQLVKYHIEKTISTNNPVMAYQLLCDLCGDFYNHTPSIKLEKIQVVKMVTQRVKEIP